MHVADPAIGILGANAIVGAGMPLAVGAALASKLLKQRPRRRLVLRRGRRQPGRRSTSRSTSPRSGTCRSSSCARTTSTPSSPTAARMTRVPSVVERCRAYGVDAERRRRQRRRGGVRGRVERGRSAAATGDGPRPDRGRDLPLARPLRGRRPALQARGRGRGLERPRPADASPARSSSAPGSRPRRGLQELARRGAGRRRGRRGSRARRRRRPRSRRRMSMSIATEPRRATWTR